MSSTPEAMSEIFDVCGEALDAVHLGSSEDCIGTYHPSSAPETAARIVACCWYPWVLQGHRAWHPLVPVQR
jgi:hypothetical protein